MQETFARNLNKLKSYSINIYSYSESFYDRF